MKSILQVAQKYRYGVIIFFVVICTVAGYFLGMTIQKNKYVHFIEGFKNIRDKKDKYVFINPLIGGNSPAATEVGIFSEIKEDIDSFLAKEKERGGITEYSFYFRDMNTGLWFGINESEDFSPASLFKLPIAIAVYKQEESAPGFLGARFVYTKEIAKLNESSSLNSDSVLIVGNSYSGKELVDVMITKSDNGAKDLLLHNMDTSFVNTLFSLVSLSTLDAGKEYQISSLAYALFLRILYNSSYLNEEHSNYILELLSTTTFKKGLVAGIPENISVAHKFGLYNFSGWSKGAIRPMFELHDCGIVYHQQNPYTFCLMTKGDSIQALYAIVAHISQMVYKNQEEER